MTHFPHTIARFSKHTMPSTTNIYKDTTILLTMSPTPAAIRIKDKSITESYKRYFEKLWQESKD